MKLGAMAVRRTDLDGGEISPMTIYVIGAGGFIGSHLCEKMTHEMDHTVLTIDVYNDKIQHLLEPGYPWFGRTEFLRINIKHLASRGSSRW